MAKELPYYKHEPSEWLEGEIQACSDAAIVCFTNLRDGYWIKLGCISYAFALQKYCRRDASILQELIQNGIVDVEGDNIRIKFLDKQLLEFNLLSSKRSDSARKRWVNANAMQLHSKSNAIREDKIREENIKEEKEIEKEIAPAKSPSPPSKKTLEEKILNCDKREKNFIEEVFEFQGTHDAKTIKEFTQYWCERTKNKTQMRWEKQETFEIAKRLATWEKRSKNFEKTNTNYGKSKFEIAQDKINERYGTNFGKYTGFGGIDENP